MSDELYRVAMRKAATSRQRAITSAHEYKAQILQKIPELLQIEQQKSTLGIKVAQLGIAGASSAQVQQITNDIKKLDEIKQELFNKHGVNEKELTPQYSCVNCKDTGFAKGKTCVCIHKLVSQMRTKDIEKSSTLKLCGFDTFDVNKYPNTNIGYDNVNARQHMQDIYNYCVDYANMFTLNNTSLYMCGYAGLGKTHLALSIAGTVLKMGYNVVYVSAQKAFATIEKEHFGQPGDTLSTMENADLLILDDLGTEFISPYISACLYSLINTRCMKKPTIYTSNIINDDDLRRRYTEKIVSRLLGSCEVLTFCGEDIRLQGK